MHPNPHSNQLPQTNSLTQLYETLYKTLGPRRWWPAKNKSCEGRAFEIAVGAILTQQVAWRNVEPAIENLRQAKLLNASALAGARASLVERLVKSTGFYRQKTRRIKAFAEWLVAEYGGRVTELLALPLWEARRRLLSFNGIGRETADSILLYAGGKRIFVVDAYTRRLCGRLGLLANAGGVGYDVVRVFFEERLPRSTVVYKEMHALIVELCKRSCRTKPVCGSCVLKPRCLYAANHANKNKCRR